MVERHSSLGCPYDHVFTRWVGTLEQAAGSEDGTVTFRPFFPRATRLCVFVSDANGSTQLVGQTVAALPESYGMQRSSGYDCPYFGSQSAAQYYFELYPADPSRLDGDHDGIACEDNPSPYGAETVPPEPTSPQITPPTWSPPPACTVPSVVGLALDRTTTSLAAADCSLGDVREAYSPTAKRGLVISQSVPLGSVRSDHFRISVVVSRGPRPVALSRAKAVHYMAGEHDKLELHCDMARSRLQLPRQGAHLDRSEALVLQRPCDAQSARLSRLKDRPSLGAPRMWSLGPMRDRPREPANARSRGIGGAPERLLRASEFMRQRSSGIEPADDCFRLRSTRDRVLIS